MYNRKGHGTQEPTRLSFLSSLPFSFLFACFLRFRTTDNQRTIYLPTKNRSEIFTLFYRTNSIDVDFTMHTHTSFPNNVNEHEVGVDTRRSKVICIVFLSIFFPLSFSSVVSVRPSFLARFTRLFYSIQNLSFIHSFSRCFPVICACTGNLPFITD